MFDRILSQPSARVVAIARLSLALVFLAATISDPGVALTTEIYFVLGAYFAFATLVTCAIWKNWWIDARIAAATHFVDMLFFVIVVFWPEGYASPYFLFFVFLLLSAAIRWGWRATLQTAVVVISLYLAAGLLVARPTEPGFELQRFIIRSGYLVVLSLILIWFGLRRRFSTGALVADRSSEIETDADSPFQAAFLHAKVVLKAGSGLAVWSHPDGEQEAYRSKGAEFAPLLLPGRCAVTETRHPFLFSVAKGRALKDSEAPAPRFRTVGTLIDAQILDEIGPKQGLAIPIHDQLGDGVFIYWSIPALHTDHLELGRQLSAHLAQLIEHRALISARQEGAIARERMSLARDLHDGIVQFLAGSTYRIEAISRSVGDQHDVAASLQDLKELMLLEQEDLRTSIAALRTDTVDLAQVTKDARALCDRLGRHWQIDCSFAADVSDRTISSRLHLDILQIIREAVANAVRHSSTKKVDVRVNSPDELVMLKIRNDGVATKDEPTSGPWSIRERVRESGGTMSMTSGRRGTELSVQFPLVRGRP